MPHASKNHSVAERELSTSVVADSKRPATLPRERIGSPLRDHAVTIASKPWRPAFRSVFVLAILSSVLLWASFPPLDLWPLAWAAPIGWVLLIRRESFGFATHLGAQPAKSRSRVIRIWRRPYVQIWLAGFLFWLGVLHWLRLPHWATSIGWIALSFYLALYLPAFVALSRVAVHRLGCPVIVAAPVVWTGLELLRGHLLTGFTMASLGHTQYRWTEMIQVADLAGAYGVGFVVMFAAACLARMWPMDNRCFAAWPLAALAVVLGLVYGYGRLAMQTLAADEGPRVALIQGVIDTEFRYEPDRSQRMHEHYLKLSRQAIREHPNLDLIVWPETMYGFSHVTFDPRLMEQDRSNPEEAQFQDRVRWAAQQSKDQLRETARLLASESKSAPHLLLGLDIQHCRLDGFDRFNSAVFLNPAGRIVGRYDKMHPVMFGEYVPLGGTIPWLYSLTPMSGGIATGERAAAFAVGNLRLCPNICYESLVPHLIRRQVLELKASGREPDVLVNLTNDGWFWGSSELDLHLASNVFRAVEFRKPMLVAANTGFSAWIDAQGRLLDRGPRRDTGIVLARISKHRESSHYLRYGDWFGGLCLVGCVGLAVLGIAGLRRHRPLATTA